GAPAGVRRVLYLGVPLRHPRRPRHVRPLLGGGGDGRADRGRAAAPPRGARPMSHRIPPRVSEESVLRGWKQIAQYLERSEDSVRRLDLPVARVGRSVMTTPRLVARWRVGELGPVLDRVEAVPARA